MLALHTRIVFDQTAETTGALAGLVGVTSASLPEPRGTLETHAARVSLKLTRGTIMPEELYAGAEGGAVALGQAGGGVAEGGKAVQRLEDG